MPWPHPGLCTAAWMHLSQLSSMSEISLRYLIRMRTASCCPCAAMKPPFRHVRASQYSRPLSAAGPRGRSGRWPGKPIEHGLHGRAHESQTGIIVCSCHMHPRCTCTAPVAICTIWHVAQRIVIVNRCKTYIYNVVSWQHRYLYM